MRIASIAALITLIALPGAAIAQSTPPAATPPAATAPAAPGASTARSEMTPEMKARAEKFRAACGADLQTHCASVSRGTDQARNDMRTCIDTHKVKFSATCQAAIVERDAARDARKAAQPTDKPKT